MERLSGTTLNVLLHSIFALTGPLQARHSFSFERNIKLYPPVCLHMRLTENIYQWIDASWLERRSTVCGYL